MPCTRIEPNMRMPVNGADRAPRHFLESVSSLLPGGNQAWLADHERQVLQLATAGASALSELEQSRRERAHQYGVGLFGQIG
jgi:hypothetical protein